MYNILNFFSIESHIKKEEIKGLIPNIKNLYYNYWSVASPAAIEGVFLNLILLADLIMVGNLGIAKAAAIGIVSQPKMIMQLIGKSIGTGVTAVIARRKGEKNYKDLNSCIKQSFIITFLIYIIITSFALIYRRNILNIMGANSEYIEFAIIYFTYLTFALFFKALSSVLIAVHVGIGNTKMILNASLIGNITNVILNYILIFGKLGMPRLEIKGAAIATIIGEFIIFIILLFSVIYKFNDKVDIRNNGSYKISKKIIKPVYEIGFNSFLEQIFERIGLFIFARLIAELGTEAVGTHHYCIIIWDLYYYFGLGMGTASSSFAGRTIGEKREDLAKIYMIVAQKSGLIISFIVSIILLVFKKHIFASIVSNNSVIILGSSILIIIALLIIPQTQAQILCGILRGAGDNRFIAQYSLFISAILKSLIAYLLAFKLNLGLHGIWIALIIDETLKMLLSTYRIKTGIWLKKVI